MTAVHGVLADNPAEWLLVFDNVTDRASVQPFVPPAGRGRVLITTQNQHWPPGLALDVPVLDVEEVLEWPLVTKLPLAPAYLVGIFNLRGAIVPLIDIAMTEGRRPGLLPKHVVVASLRGEGHHDDVRIGIASDEVIGTYSVSSEDLLEQAPENVPHCVGMLRHDDRLALLIDLRRLLEVFPGPSI